MLAYRKALQHAGLSAEQAGLSTDRKACLPTGRHEGSTVLENKCLK
jgi:hypothetical protein